MASQGAGSEMDWEDPMTTPCPETIEREKDKLYVTDVEIIRRLGVPERVGRMMIQHLTDRGGFPPKQKLWGNRRFWPAVERYLYRENGLTVDDVKPIRERRHA